MRERQISIAKPLPRVSKRLYNELSFYNRGTIAKLVASFKPTIQRPCVDVKQVSRWVAVRWVSSKLSNGQSLRSRQRLTVNSARQVRS